MAWEPKVNRHCAYIAAPNAKRRPAIITGFATDSNPILRVGHHGETYGNATTGIARKLDPTLSTTNVYVSW